MAVKAVEEENTAVVELRALKTKALRTTAIKRFSISVLL